MEPADRAQAPLGTASVLTARPVRSDWPELVSFTYATIGDELAVVSVVCALTVPMVAPAGAQLIIHREAVPLTHTPAGSVVRGRAASDPREGPLWRATFAIARELVEFPGIQFELSAPGRRGWPLPAPPHVDIVGLGFPRARSRDHAGLHRLLVLAAVTTSVTFSAAAISLAATVHSPVGAGSVGGAAAGRLTPAALRWRATAPPPRVRVPATLAAVTAAPPVPTPPPSSPAANAPPALTPAPATATPGVVGGMAPPTGAKPPAATGAPPVGAAVPTPVSARPPVVLTGTTVEPPSGQLRATHRAVHHPPPGPRVRTGDQRGHPVQRPHSTGGASIAPPAAAHQRTSRPAAPTTRVPDVPADVDSGATGSSQLTAGSQFAPLTMLSPALAGDQPPPYLIPIYQAAGRRYGVPWRILAGINSIETDFGRNLSVSSAGAIGWMQFMPATWREYGVTRSGRGTPDPYDPSDAIFSAARYLQAGGAAHDLRGAIFTYNHASWYVEEVIRRARAIRPGRGRVGSAGYALPLDRRYMGQLGRTDDGLDIETAPDGSPVYSMTPGEVTAIAVDPGGFGPNYPVIRVSAGPLTGRFIYYGHVAASLVQVGERVLAGQPIAVMGHTGDAAGLGHGHIEIGFGTGAGDPLNHHGPVAWTAAGNAMRQVVVDIAAQSGINGG